MYTTPIPNILDRKKEKVSFLPRPLASLVPPSPDGEFLQIYSLSEVAGPTGLFPDHLRDGTSSEMLDEVLFRVYDAV